MKLHLLLIDLGFWALFLVAWVLITDAWPDLDRAAIGVAYGYVTVLACLYLFPATWIRSRR